MSWRPETSQPIAGQSRPSSAGSVVAVLSGLRNLLLSILLCFVTVVVAVFAGPVTSGAVLLLVSSHAPAAEHDLPDPYAALHKGRVDPGTGLYIREDEDLVVRGTPPLVLRRVYVSNNRTAKEFGIGTTHSAERYLVGDNDRTSLVLSDGSRIPFERITPGTSLLNAIYEAHATPGEWLGTQLGWAGFGWAMRRRDSSFALFQACGSNAARVCSIVQERDWDGHAIYYPRDFSGRLSRMQASADRWIAFDYDERDRISRASDSTGRAVRYEYDDAGRLIRVTATDGTAHRYTYTERDQMATIVDPGATVENAYDANGRCIRQVNWVPDELEPYTVDFTYRMHGAAVVEARSTRSDGTWLKYAFGDKGDAISETWGRRGSPPAIVTYTRDPGTRVLTSVTVTCPDKTGRSLPHSKAITPASEEVTKRDLLQTQCSWMERSVR